MKSPDRCPRRSAPRPTGLGETGGRWAAVLACAYFVGAVVYGLVVPMWEGPDEGAHFAFLRFVARARRIPDAIQEYDSYAWVPTHGPLYYFAAAPFIQSLDLSDTSVYPLSNPQATVNDPDGLGNRNGLVHTPLEQWPFENGNVRALHVGRVVTAAFGALTVAATVLIGFRFAPAVGVVAGLLVAANPEFLFLGGLVHNDVPGAALATVALLSLIRYWEKPARTRAMVAGLVIGLAVLAKASNLGLLLPAAVLVLARRKLEWRRMLLEGLVILIASFVVSGWWLALNYVRYGDPTGLAGSLELMPGEQVSYSDPQNLLGLMRFTVISAWALFGPSNVTAPGWVYWGLSALALIALGGLVWSRIERRLRPTLLLCVAWAVIISVAGMSWEMRVRSWHARHFLPAIGMYALLLALGMEGWRRRFRWGVVSYALPVASVSLALLAPAFIIAPAYRPPPSVAALPPEANPVCAQFPDDGLELLGVAIDEEVQPGDVLSATLYWRLEHDIDYDLIQFIRVLDGGFEPIASLNAYHGSGNWPTKLWAPGMIYADTVQLRIKPEARTPDLARLILTLDRYGEELVASCEHAANDPLTPYGQVRVIEPSPPLRESILTLGDGVELASADWPDSARPGDTVQIALRWNVRNPPPGSITRFLHLERAGDLVAQSDGIPAGFPSFAWRSGDVLDDTVSLTIPPTAPLGDYSLLVGMYDETGQRLSAPAPDNRALLGTLRVES